MRVALVTGSSRGLGRHIAFRLGHEGFAVAVNGLDSAEAGAVAKAIHDGGATADAFVADVTDEPQVGELVSGIAASLGAELAPFGITVNAVAPGFIPVERHADVSEETRAHYVAGVPVGRFGTPAELAHAVAFFASDEAGYVTGQRVVVDGGRSLA